MKVALLDDWFDTLKTFGLIERSTTSPTSILLEYSLGILEVVLEWRKSLQNDFILNSARPIRAARKISQGHLFISDTL